MIEGLFRERLPLGRRRALGKAGVYEQGLNNERTCQYGGGGGLWEGDPEKAATPGGGDAEGGNAAQDGGGDAGGCPE